MVKVYKNKSYEVKAIKIAYKNIKEINDLLYRLFNENIAISFSISNYSVSDKIDIDISTMTDRFNFTNDDWIVIYKNKILKLDNDMFEGMFSECEINYLRPKCFGGYNTFLCCSHLDGKCSFASECEKSKCKRSE